MSRSFAICLIGTCTHLLVTMWGDARLGGEQGSG